MRLFSVTAFIGGGANIGFGNDEANELANAGYDMRYVWSGTKVRPVGRGGLSFDFRVSDRVSLGIEGNANVLSDKYNSKRFPSHSLKIKRWWNFRKKEEVLPSMWEICIWDG